MYWDLLAYGPDAQNIGSAQESDLLTLKTLWLINYSIAFLCFVLYLNHKRWGSDPLGIAGVNLLTYAIGIFLVIGLPQLGDSNSLHPFFRYVCLAFVILGLYTGSWMFTRNAKLTSVRIPFELLLHLVILWILSSELIHWLEVTDTIQSDKLGLTILWGVYSFALIALGIWKSRAYLRIAAIVLFGITLVKLFFYDISNLDTISKTIVFLAIGALLLGISFLYTKYRDVLFGGQTAEEQKTVESRP